MARFDITANNSTKFSISFDEPVDYAGVLKRWNGSSWVNATLKRWDGGSFVVVDSMKIWTGADWELINTGQ